MHPPLFSPISQTQKVICIDNPIFLQDSLMLIFLVALSFVSLSIKWYPIFMVIYYLSYVFMMLCCLQA